MRDSARPGLAPPAAALALLEGVPPDAPIGFALVDADGRALTVSPSLAAPGGELAAELAAAVGAALAGVLAGGAAVALSAEGRAADGARREWEIELRRLDVRGRVLAGVIAVDVSIVARAEAELRESERQLAAAQRIARAGWWAWTAAAGRVTLSPDLAGILGLDPARVEALEAEELLDVVIGSDRPAERAELFAAIAERRPFRLRQRIRRPDGGVRVIESEGEAVVGPDGEVAEVRGIGQDITTLERGGARQRAVAELGRLALGGVAVEELLDRACLLVADALWADWVTVHEHGSRDRGLRAGVAVPIDTPRRPFGELRVQPEVARPFDEDEIAFLDSVAHILGEAIGHRDTTTAIAALAASRGRLVGQALDAEDRARRGVAERLHDGPLQDLVAAAHGLHGHGGSPEAAERAREIARDLREIMAALHPTVLRYGGLRAALTAVAEQHGPSGSRAVVEIDDDAGGHHDELLLSVARHLLAGAARQPAPSQVAVSLRRTAGGVRLEVAADGHAVAADAVASTAERVAAVGGTLHAEPGPGGGMRVVVELPAAGPPAKA